MREPFYRFLCFWKCFQSKNEKRNKKSVLRYSSSVIQLNECNNCTCLVTKASPENGNKKELPSENEGICDKKKCLKITTEWLWTRDKNSLKWEAKEIK